MIATALFHMDFAAMNWFLYLISTRYITWVKYECNDLT